MLKFMAVVSEIAASLFLAWTAFTAFLVPGAILLGRIPLAIGVLVVEGTFAFVSVASVFGLYWVAARHLAATRQDGD